jgi:hypothetical protein
MQNREELRKNGQNGSRKTVSREGEKISFSEGGGGINILLGPKYRPPIICEVLIGISVLKQPTPNATVFFTLWLMVLTLAAFKGQSHQILDYLLGSVKLNWYFPQDCLWF